MIFYPKRFFKSVSVCLVFESRMERGRGRVIDRLDADRKWCHRAAGGLLLDVVVADALSADDTLHQKREALDLHLSSYRIFQ